MRKKVLFLLSLLHGILIVLSLLSAFTAVPRVLTPGYDQVREFPLSLSVFIPFFVSYAASRKCRSIFTFLFFSIAAVVLMCLIPMNKALKVLNCLIAAWIILVRIFYRIKEDGGTDMLMSPSALALILFGFLYLIGLFSGIRMIRDMNYVLAFLYVILILIYRNLRNLERYLEVNSSIENIPKRQISRTNTGALVLVIIVVCIFMLLFPLIGIDQLLIKMKDALVALLRLIFQGKGVPADVVPESTRPEEMLPPGYIPDGQMLPDWALAIFAVIRTFFVILAAAFALYLIGYGIYSVIKRFYRPYHDNEDVQEFIRDDPDQKESLFREVLLKRFAFLDTSLQGSIRRAYKKTIEKGLAKQKKKAADLSAFSPEELEDAAALEKDEKRASLHETYEKARYSNEPLTKEDMKKVRG